MRAAGTDHVGVAEIFRGTLIGESLRSDETLADVALTVWKIFRLPAGDVMAGQPRVLTFIEFETPRQEVERLADSLSRAMNDRGGWYCDLRSRDEVVVVFPGRIFRYARGDRDARSEVEAHGRSLGVPEPQLDWPE